ncbi:hypothetical protein ACCT32_37335, partial [Rhizobium brockwellii]|uniref:hypothetical protein n=1 Tax=Rhizobium brockwellii TaxID=3019932 RepID=UPI003F970899
FDRLGFHHRWTNAPSMSSGGAFLFDAQLKTELLKLNRISTTYRSIIEVIFQSSQIMQMEAMVR